MTTSLKFSNTFKRRQSLHIRKFYGRVNSLTSKEKFKQVIYSTLGLSETPKKGSFR